MGAVTQMYSERLEIEERLWRLGLKREPFDKAAAESYAAFAGCTDHHPPTYPGTAAWAEANRSLRDSLVLLGWTRKNETNQPLIINPGQTMAITASSGDEYTGRKDEKPSTRSSKGARTKEYIRANQRSFDFMYEPSPEGAFALKPGRATWLFLIYRDLKHGQMRYELSLPTSMTDDGHVDDWAERILFPPTPIDTTENFQIGDDDGGQSPQITVEITKLG